MSVRIFGRRKKNLPVFAGANSQISIQDLGAGLGQDRYSHRSAGIVFPDTYKPGTRRKFGNDTRASLRVPQDPEIALPFTTV